MKKNLIVIALALGLAFPVMSMLNLSFVCKACGSVDNCNGIADFEWTGGWTDCYITPGGACTVNGAYVPASMCSQNQGGGSGGGGDEEGMG